VFYKYANSKLKTRSGIADLENEDGSTTTNDKEKAQLLNNFFSSVFTIEGTHNIPTKAQLNIPESLTNLNFNEIDIIKLLEKLKVNKSPGPESLGNVEQL